MKEIQRADMQTCFWNEPFRDEALLSLACLFSSRCGCLWSINTSALISQSCSVEVSRLVLVQRIMRSTMALSCCLLKGHLKRPPQRGQRSSSKSKQAPDIMAVTRPLTPNYKLWRLVPLWGNLFLLLFLILTFSWHFTHKEKTSTSPTPSWQNVSAARIQISRQKHRSTDGSGVFPPPSLPKWNQFNSWLTAEC